MTLAPKGLPGKLIAKELAVSYRTVEQHRSSLLDRLDGGSSTEFMRPALFERAAGMRDQPSAPSTWPPG